jgi:hypothetical protein
MSFRTEADLLEVLKKQTWVEDFEVSRSQLVKLAKLLVLYQELKKDGAAVRQRISIDGSEEKRISKLVRQANKFEHSLREALGHPGVKLCLFDAHPTTGEDLKSVQQFVKDSEHLVTDLRKTRIGRGAPTKVVESWLLRELATHSRSVLGRSPKPLYRWDKRHAEAARITKEIAALVGVTVSAKTIQNLLSRS